MTVPMFVRGAVDGDAGMLLQWRNDSITRAMSRTVEPVRQYDHVKWLEESLLRDRDCRRLYVCGSPPVGTVRFDRYIKESGGEHVWEVSITIAPEHRGKGLAKHALAGAVELLRNECRADTIVAEIKRVNEPSCRLFEGFGFARTKENAEYFTYLGYPWHITLK